jgi:hypothetical protein
VSSTEDKVVYKRLPGWGRLTRGGVYASTRTLWLGPDHILQIDDERMEETYKRFYFRDIRNIVIQKTMRGFVWNIVLVALTCAFLALMLVGFQSKWDVGVLVFTGIVAGMFSILLFINWLRGPTCKCFIATAVQIEQFHSLHRLRTALKVARRINVLAQAVQGTLTPQDIEQHQHDMVSVRPAAAKASAPLKHCHGTPHLILYSLLFANMLDTAGHIFAEGAVPESVGMTIFLAVLVANTFALAKQHKTDLPRNIRVLTWATLVYLVTLFSASIVIGFAMVVTGHFQAKTKLSPNTSLPLMVLSIASMTTDFVLGLTGLLLTRKFREASATPPPAPPPSAPAGTSTGQGSE